MKTLLAVVGHTVAVLSSGIAMAQDGGMMSGGGWGGGWTGGYGGMGGFGGILVPILLIIMVAGLVVWVVKQKGK